MMWRSILILLIYMQLSSFPSTLAEETVFSLFVYSFFLCPVFGGCNGTPLQYSCLENPWTEDPGRLQSMGSLRVRHNWATSLSLFSFMHWRRKWQPTLVLLPGKSHGQRSLVGSVSSQRVGHDWAQHRQAGRQAWRYTGHREHSGSSQSRGDGTQWYFWVQQGAVIEGGGTGAELPLSTFQLQEWWY